MIRPLILILTVFEIGCSTIPKPHSDLCVANAPNQTRKCYWTDKDYDNNGNLLPTAVANYQPMTSINDVNKWTMTDPDSWANLKAYLKDLEQELAACNSK